MTKRRRRRRRKRQRRRRRRRSEEEEGQEEDKEKEEKDKKKTKTKRRRRRRRPRGNQSPSHLTCLTKQEKSGELDEDSSTRSGFYTALSSPRASLYSPDLFPKLIPRGKTTFSSFTNL